MISLNLSAHELAARRYFPRATRLVIGNDGLAERDEHDFELWEGEHLFDIKVDTSGDEMGFRHSNSARGGLS